MRRSAILRNVAPIISYHHQPSKIPFLAETVGERFGKSAEASPEKVFCVFSHQNLRKTYAEVYTDSRLLASSLLSLGLRSGDRVGVWGPNFYQWITTHFACALAGLVAVNVNPAYRVPELQYALRKVGVKALVTPSHYRTSQYYRSVCEIVPELLRSEEGEGHVNSHLLPDLKHLVVFDAEGSQKSFHGAWNFGELLRGAGSEGRRALGRTDGRASMDAPFNIQFTSGTTGTPKAATLTHFGVLNNAYFTGINTHFHKNDEVVCVPNPLYHTFGCVAGLLNAMVHRQTVVFPSETFNAGKTLDAIRSERATFVFGTPTMFIDILNHPDFKSADVSSVRGGYIAAAPIPQALARRMLDELHMTKMTVLYGCTETSPVVSVSSFEQSPEQRIRNCGYTLDHCETAVVDASTGLPVSRGCRGELLTRGYHVMRGYWADEGLTREVVDDSGWYRTGDIAVMADDGAISIVGRSKDLIIRGGENVYPPEVEAVIFTHPAVADVHVIGVPDVRLGEEVCAWVRLRNGHHLTAEQLTAYCKQKMAHHSVPRYILFKEEHDFPLTATGKVLKFELRKLSKKELKLEQTEAYFNE